jgi:bifunctional non-homologous end joining protein LigD
LSSAQLQALTEQLPRIITKDSPFDNQNLVSADANFVKPVLSAAVEFVEWTDQGSMRSPVIKGFMVDNINPRD